MKNVFLSELEESLLAYLLLVNLNSLTPCLNGSLKELENWTCLYTKFGDNKIEYMTCIKLLQTNAHTKHKTYTEACTYIKVMPCHKCLFYFCFLTFYFFNQN